MQVPEGSLSFIKWVLKQEPHPPRHGKEHRAKTGGLGSTPTLRVTLGWSFASLYLCFPDVKMQGLGYTGRMGTTKGTSGQGLLKVPTTAPFQHYCAHRAASGSPLTPISKRLKLLKATQYPGSQSQLRRKEDGVPNRPTSWPHSHAMPPSPPEVHQSWEGL